MATERTAWGKRPDESAKAFAAFSIYRDMGADRSIRLAVLAFLGDETADTRQHRRFRQAADPTTYAKGVKRSWEVWSKRHEWVARAGEYDEHLDFVRRKAVLEAELASEATERDLRLAEARGARTAGRSVLSRFLALIETQALAGVDLSKTKTITVTKDVKTGQILHRHEVETKGITDLLPLAIQAIVEGQKLERLELGEVTSREETVLTSHVLEKLAEAIRKHVPEDQWDKLLLEFDNALSAQQKED